LKQFLKYSCLLFIVLNLTSCIQYKEVQIVNVKDVGIKNITPKGIEIEVAMQIKNPNKYAISIVESDLLIFIKEKKIGTAAIKEKVKLGKKSNEIYRFTIQTKTEDLLSGIFPIMMGAITKKSLDLHVLGDIKAKAKGLSKKVPIDFRERVKL